MAKTYYYGGQAVMEGVMMRGRKAMVTAVREPKGTVTMQTEPLSGLYTGWLRKTPLLRGVVVLIEAMVLGVKSLMFSANVSLEEEGEKISSWSIGLMVIVSLGFTVALFFLAPLFLTRLLGLKSSIVFNLVDGVIRMAIFIGYLKAMSLMPDIRRVFAYHGAEHKTVNAYEAGVPLEIEHVKKFSTAHVRCGTSFVFVVVVMSILVFALIGVRAAWLMALSRVLLIPVIAALSYELVYFSGRHSKNGFVRTIMAPGMWLQSLTTRPPDDGQIEVAITALKRAVELDQAEPALATPA